MKNTYYFTLLLAKNLLEYNHEWTPEEQKLFNKFIKNNIGREVTLGISQKRNLRYKKQGRQNKKWTKEEDEIFERLLKLKAPTKLISFYLGRTEIALKNREKSRTLSV